MAKVTTNTQRETATTAANATVKPLAAGIPSLPDKPSLSLAALCLQQNYNELAGTKKIITTIPVRKPGQQAYVRVRSGDEWKFTCAILQLREDGECYLVVPGLFQELVQEVRPKLLYAAITRDGTPFLWPVNLPGDDGRLDAWSQSAHTAAKYAETDWIRIVANRNAGAYDVMQARNLKDEPAWPDMSLEDLVLMAFRGRMIDSIDHPIVKRLRGEL
jgi:hypothetical protein